MGDFHVVVKIELLRRSKDVIRKIEFEHCGDKCILEFDDTEEMRQKLFDAVLGWFIKQGHFSGESIMQSDGPLLDGPVFLSELADDVFCFKETWIEPPAPQDGE